MQPALQESADEEVTEFLSVLKPGTRRVYSHGLSAFQRFYAQQGSIKEFLNLVEEDQRKPRWERKRVARTTLNAFVIWLENHGYKPKSIRAYVGAIQSLAKYFDISISLLYVDLPPAQAISKKHPWTIWEISKFVTLMENPIYKSIAASIVQSGLSLSDLLSLTYGDINVELEKNITPLCLDLSRKKTSVPFMTFLGDWAIKLLKEHLINERMEEENYVYNVTARAVDAYFCRIARKFAGKFHGRNPYSPHSLRAAFRTLLSDHKVDPLYIEFWMGHKVPEQQRVYISKSREGWRQTYREQAEPWLTPH
ncbi:MAG: tyrosine-type recombinase/integrase [Candidatus Bathyarchaeales archaeon]